MSDETPEALLKRAADHLEKLARDATPGPWRRHDTHLPFGGYTATVLTGQGRDIRLLAWLPTMSNEPWDQTRNVWNDSKWMAAMNPTTAAPLVAWLRAEARFVRRNAAHMHGDVEHLPSMRFARALTEEA